MEDQITLDQVEAAIEGIVEKYNADFYPFGIRQTGGGWQFLTKKDYHKTVAQLNGEKYLKRLSAASLETLAIIAYKQPITKGEVEAIRGVNSDYSIQKLLEKELIIITGRNEELPGKPLIYNTSKTFMDYFGINSAGELPKIREVLADQVVEPTIVSPELSFDPVHDKEKHKEGKADSETGSHDVQNEPEVNGADDLLLVVRGNGELIEEPDVVVDDNTDVIAPASLISNVEPLDETREALADEVDPGLTGKETEKPHDEV